MHAIDVTRWGERQPASTWLADVLLYQTLRSAEPAKLYMSGMANLPVSDESSRASFYLRIPPPGDWHYHSYSVPCGSTVMASSIPLHEYATPDQRAAEIPAPEDSGASSTAVAETGLNTPAPGGQLPAASDTTRDSVPIRDAAQVPGESVPATDKTPPKPFWKKNSFWNKVLTPTNTLLTVINFAPTFMTRTVDDRRLALDYSKARGEQWSRDIVFRQQCEKDRVSLLFASLFSLRVRHSPLTWPGRMHLSSCRRNALMF